MKIKLSLFFTILFCFVTQESFGSAQNNTDTQTVQDTGVIHTVNDGNNNADDSNLYDVVNQVYVNSEGIDALELNSVSNAVPTEDSYGDVVEISNKNDTVITDNVINNNISSNSNMNNTLDDNIIVIDGDTTYDDIVYDEDLANVDSVTTVGDTNNVVNNNMSNTNSYNQNTNTSLDTSNNVVNANTETDMNDVNNVDSTGNINLLGNSNDVNNMNDNMHITENQVKKIERVYVSLMFTESNIQDIFKALPASSTGIPTQYSAGFGANGQSEGDGEGGKKTQLSVYLNSIMYISDNAWSAWVNGYKMTNMNKGVGDLRILEISPLNATFVWKFTPLQWQAINQSGLIPMENYKDNGDYVDLYFTLSPNQTYIPSLNQILEGNQRQVSTSNHTQDSATQEDTAVVNAQTEELFF